MQFFHVSYHDLGKKHLFLPRIPKTRSDNECEKTLRICVSTSVEGCLLGREGLKTLKQFKENEILHNIVKFGPPQYVYVLKSELWLKPTSEQCPDADITKEHWIIEKVISMRLGRLDLKKLSDGLVKIMP